MKPVGYRVAGPTECGNKNLFSLLPSRLTRKIAPNLPPKALFCDGKWRRQNEIRIALLLGMLMVLEMRFAITVDRCAKKWSIKYPL